MKLLYVLVGPKGAGKTYIGTLLDAKTKIRFLRVEPIWLALPPGKDGWHAVEQEIDCAFQQTDKVMIETLGVGEDCTSMLTRLGKKYHLKFIQVTADLTECLRRVRTRDQSIHIPVADEKVLEYNEIAARVYFPWHAVIINDGNTSNDGIIQKLLECYLNTNNCSKGV